MKVKWETHLAGAEALKKKGTTIPQELMDSFEKNKVALKGPVTTPVGEGFASVNVELRQTFDLYANLRPIKNLPGVKARYRDVDLIVVRENTEGLYSGIEHEVVPGVMESLKIITEKASTRIAKFAFDFARSHNRKKIAAIHKANIMKLTDGLFLDCARRMAVHYPDIAFGDLIVDNACLQLVLDPSSSMFCYWKIFTEISSRIWPPVWWEGSESSPAPIWAIDMRSLKPFMAARLISKGRISPILRR